MKLEQIKQLIERCNKLLPVASSINYTEAEKRAGEFLMAMAAISEARHQVGESKIKNQSLQSSIYAAELSKGTAKTVTENKTAAEASAIYQDVREAYEGDDNDTSYLKAIYEVYNNAHIFYRGMSKQEFK